MDVRKVLSVFLQIYCPCTGKNYQKTAVFGIVTGYHKYIFAV